MNNIIPQFTLCFLTCRDQVLLLHRLKPPNQGLWNGVGGHIEPGEPPLRSCLREIKEETGVSLATLNFNGLLTWEGFEIPSGGLYLFSAETPTLDFQPCSEGELAWHAKDWACRAPQVVSNLHLVLPFVFTRHPPQIYHFVYQGQNIQSCAITPLTPS